MPVSAGLFEACDEVTISRLEIMHRCLKTKNMTHLFVCFSKTLGTTKRGHRGADSQGLAGQELRPTSCSFELVLILQRLLIRGSYGLLR